MGFIGSNFIVEWVQNSDEVVINFDCLTYASNKKNLKEIQMSKNYLFIQGNILDKKKMEETLAKFSPRVIFNFAAESHVDNSINDPHLFVETNVLGTNNLLTATLSYWNNLKGLERDQFRFVQISTDEVFGSLKKSAPPVTEKSPFKPNNPYAASKAGGDHLVRAYNKTYGLPTLVTHSSNNFGPRQYSEKLIPLVINRALSNKSIPIYGDGRNVRDWIYVRDNCKSIIQVWKYGIIGESYNIGANNEIENNELVRRICKELDEKVPDPRKQSYFELVEYVPDRSGHDTRYSLNTKKVKKIPGIEIKHDFDKNFGKTVEWYICQFSDLN